MEKRSIACFPILYWWV